MKWGFSIRQKIKAALLLLVVFVLILAKNLLDRRNVAKLGDSFLEFYEDRLLPESYIYKMSNLFYQKKYLINKCADEIGYQHIKPGIQTLNDALAALTAAFEKTRLTEAEAKIFYALKKDMESNAAIEGEFNNPLETDAAFSGLMARYDASLDIILHNFNLLSGIQISEGKKLNDDAKSIVAGSVLLTEFEMVLLIVIGMLIQILIFSSKSLISNASQRPSLN